MFSDYDETLLSQISYHIKQAKSAVKGCYIPGCREKPIRSHSISKRQVLDRISENGKVIMLDTNYLITCNSIEVGVNQATTLKCFCGKHDREIFSAIDNHPYTMGNRKQEFLFAFRAAAREYYSKLAAVYTLNDSPKETAIDDIQIGQLLSVKDQGATRKILVDTLFKDKFNVIDTSCIILNNEYPLVACSSFNMEVSNTGKLINDVTPNGYDQAMKPCFLNLFPQNGKTYCLLSYLHRHRRDYLFLKELANLSEVEKKVVISNILVNYVENFAVRPSYWNSGIKDIFPIGQCLEQVHTSFISDENLNLFI